VNRTTMNGRAPGLWLTALVLALACSNTPRDDDDDDDSNGGESGESATGGTSGSASGGKGGGASGGTQGGTDATGGSATGGASGETTGGSDATGGTGDTGGSSTQGGMGQGAVGGDMGQSGEGQAGDASPGSGGSDATGGTGGSGGDAGTAGTGGDAGTGGTSGGPGGTPLVQLLIDGSSSMFENGMWDQVYASLVTDGLVDAFQGKLELGLAVFQGSTTPSTETSASCATMTSTDFSTDSGAAVESTLSALSGNYMVGDKYETPTGFAVHYVSMVLAATSVPAGTKKYIVLVTDGAPNTCAVLDPQCGEDVSIKAVQGARANGIRTLAVGLDPILATDSGCPSDARCGEAHIQDLANAGVAEPVEPPNVASFIHQPCNNGVALLATYADVGGGGDATYYFNTNEGGLTGELTKALEAIVDDTVP
jgi:hypothetical protein